MQKYKKKLVIMAGISLFAISSLTTAYASYSSGSFKNNQAINPTYVGYNYSSNNTYNINYSNGSNNWYNNQYWWVSKTTQNNSQNNQPTNDQTSNGNTSTKDNSTTTVTNSYKGLSEQETELVNLINKERQDRGLAPLAVDEDLSKVAKTKAQDMKDNNYFSHTSPTYGSPFDMMKKFGISYNAAAENIAKNSDVLSAHYAFMNSTGHRENILNAYYNKVGVGVVSNTAGNGVIVVEMFIND